MKIYYKLNWPQGGWAIVSDYKERKSPNSKISGIGIFLFGSKRGTECSGKKFMFSNVINVEIIDSAEVERIVGDNFEKIL
jgi:hypothetical protein